MADDERTVTVGAQEWEGPQTQEEARCFHQGYLSGLTVYAREKGDSTLKSDNELLRRLMDEQGWKTIENFERLPSSQTVFDEALAILELAVRRNGLTPVDIQSAEKLLKSIGRSVRRG